MKNSLLAIALISSTLFACQGSNDIGECVGLGKQKPGYTYEIDTRNAIWTAAAGWGLVIPVAWALEYAYCPVSKTEVK